MPLTSEDAKDELTRPIAPSSCCLSHSSRNATKGGSRVQFILRAEHAINQSRNQIKKLLVNVRDASAVSDKMSIRANEDWQPGNSEPPAVFQDRFARIWPRGDVANNIRTERQLAELP